MKILVVLLFISGLFPSFAQTTLPPSVHLDVVSIRENSSGTDKGYLEISPNGARIIVRNTAMFRIIGFAYNKQRNDLIEGLPGWTRDLRWDIEATIAEESIPAFHSMPFESKKKFSSRFLPTDADSPRSRVREKSRYSR